MKTALQNFAADRRRHYTAADRAANELRLLCRQCAHEFREGQIARDQGHQIDSCPYAPASTYRRVWEAGWRQAKGENA